MMSISADDFDLVRGIGLEMKRKRDVPCACGHEIAVISDGTGPHAAALVCINCGKHREWMREILVEAIVQVTKKCGRPRVALRPPELSEALSGLLNATAPELAVSTGANAAGSSTSAIVVEQELDE
jgi:hypothetical protein